PHRGPGPPPHRHARLHAAPHLELRRRDPRAAGRVSPPGWALHPAVPRAPGARVMGSARASTPGRPAQGGPWPSSDLAGHEPAPLASPCARPTLIFNRTSLPGVVTAESAAVADERGSFARTYVADVFAAHGLTAALSVTARASNTRARTLRGLHYQ